MATKNYQFRLILRPSPIGRAITSRLEAPGADRTAEARRWIELGFAAEQAGFQLDGLQLRHAGRAWDVQPTILPETEPRVSVEPAVSVNSVPGSAYDRTEGQGAEPLAPDVATAPSTDLSGKGEAVSPAQPSVIAAVPASQPLLASLRNLSAA